jgi:integrase
MLNHAVRWEIISSNPAKKVSPPRQHRQEARYYNEEQVKELLNALRTAPYKYYVAVVLALATGLRRGEIIALEWNDIDFDNKTINVNKSSQYISKKGMVTGGPKTESSIRVISIPDEVVNILKKYRTLQDDTKEKLGNIWVESNRLFTQKHGEPMYADTLSSWFRKFIQKNCLDDLNFHGLRHTSATILSSMGIDIPTISKRLGHSKPSTTSDIYAHALRSIDRKASIVIEDVLSLENYKIDGNTLNV